MQTDGAERATDVADLTLFELGSWGHFPFYMRLLFGAWAERGTGCLRAIVTNRFLNAHRFVFEGLANKPNSAIRWATLDEADEAALEAVRKLGEGIDEAQPSGPGAPPSNLILLQWSLMESYCRRFPTRHILLMNLDEYLFALGAGMEAPADLSGIFFRPSFYYRSDFQEASFRTRAFNSLQKQLIDRLLDHPQLRAAFFIDPWVAESLQATGSARVLCLKEPVRLPDNVPTVAGKTEIRRRLGLPADRKVFLLAGEISGRKGVWKVLEALDRLTLEEASRVCVAIVGHAEAAFEERLTQQLTARTASTGAAVIRRAGYLDEAELGDWFAAADVVLAPYIGFVGMSGILLLAAAHRKPVISADSGAIARITREYRLGVTVDPRSPAELARAIASFLGDSRPGWDEELAYSFAQDRSADKFGKRLLDALGPYLR